MNTPNFNPADRLRQGHALQMQGRLAEAGDIYREVLAKDPRNAPAMHLLGTLALLSGQLQPGVDLIRQSLAILPGFAPAHDNLGKGLEKMGKLDEALTSFGRVIALAPGHAEGFASRGRVLERLGRYEEALKDFDKALSLKGDPELSLNRGAVLLQMKRFEEALTAFDKAIAMGFTHPIGRFNRGVALTALGRNEDALAAYDELAARHPDFADGHVNRGLVLEKLGRPEEALASFEQAIAINADHQEAYLNRGALLTGLNRHDEAIAAYGALLARWPDDASAYNNRGNAQKSLGALEKALADFDRAVALKPDVASVQINRGNVLQALAHFDEAMIAYDTALALDPGAGWASFSKATLLLLLGRIEEGMALYESRNMRIGHDDGAMFPIETVPFRPEGVQPSSAWQERGRDIGGKTVLVYEEQGLGDAIQFARLLPLLTAQGATPVFAVRRSLLRLMQGLVPKVQVVTNDALPPHDMHAPLASLPFLLGMADALSADKPYLTPEPDLVAKWKKKIGDKGLRVGICWQGNARGRGDPFRSFPLADMAALAAVPGVRLISLQKGGGEEQLESLPKGMAVETLGADFDSGPDAFLDTLAVMETLDLVITCDTSVAHLAGALGRPAWVALQHVPEWRWQMGRDDSPWYPSLRLFRQKRRGDWSGVFAAMADALAQQAR